ncbi:hypothetical protein FNV43_RR26698 [Rhamnella rubrinervis]|uniref:Uncharacterized protein n=1 Tax=Rhamnella rubrinervis TaxID=2594499 RepID=A0A8K0DVG5_9ROSA|nr:hypothetical protein FNV43_RR26698 [Rhamnella rubrinervis]
MGQMAENLEKDLLRKERVERDGFAGSTTRLGVFVEEVKRLGYIAGPMVAMDLSQYFLQIISIMMVGHLGTLSLSSTAIAVSVCAVSGFTKFELKLGFGKPCTYAKQFGMSSALETLCGQAYGAQQYQQLGIQTNTAIFSLLLEVMDRAFVVA